MPETAPVRHEPRVGWSAVDLLFLAYPIALLTAHGQGLFIFASYTPRMALLLVAGIPGLVALVDLVRRGDAPGRLAAIVAAWIVVSAAFSGAPLLALKGTIGRESSGIIMLAALGVWALGRRASARACRSMPVAVMIGAGINAVVGVAQIVFDIDSGSFSTQFDRATGLTTNPVYFGGVMAAGAALAAGARAWSFRLRLALTAMFGLAADLSGSRVAVAVGLVAVALTVLGEAAMPERRRQLLMPAAFVVGVLLSSIVTLSSGTRSSTERLTAEQDGGGRLQVWEYGVSAVADRPLFGWGFGRFRAATQGRYSAEFVANHASDDLRQAWFDAHNVVLGVAVAVGVVGLVLFAWFAVSAGIRMRGPLVFVVVALAGTWLLQPPGLVTLPLAMFLAGVAVPGAEMAARADRMPRRYAPAVLVGVIVAGWLTVGDMLLDTAADDVDAAALEDAARLFPRDAVVADIVAQAWFVREERDTSLRPQVREWSQRAIDDEPDRPYMWRRYAERLMTFGEYEEAREALDEALELQPWHLQSWELMRFLALIVDDDELLDLAERKLCELQVPLEGC